MMMWKENISAVVELLSKVRFTILFVGLLACALAGGAMVSVVAWHAYAPLPYANDDQLVWLRGSMVDQTGNRVMDNALSNVAAQYIADNDSALSLAAPVYYGDALHLDHAKQPKLNVTYTTPEFFTLFGQSLIQGRYFEGPKPDGTVRHEAVISECFAERYMPQILQDSDKSVHSLQLDQQTFHVVGVVACSKTEPQLYLPNRVSDVYVAFKHVIDGQAMAQEHISVRYNTFVVGRTVEQLNRPVVTADITGHLNAEFRAGLVAHGSTVNNQLHFNYIPLHQKLKGSLQESSTWLLLCAVAFLLITVINLLMFYLLDIKTQHAQLVLKATLGAPLATLRTAHYWQLGVMFSLAAICAILLAELGMFAIAQFGQKNIAHIDWLQLNTVHYLLVMGFSWILAWCFAVFGFRQLSFDSLYQSLQAAGKGQAKQLPHWLSVGVLVAQLCIGLIVLCIGIWSANYFGSKMRMSSGIEPQDTIFVVRHQMSWDRDEAAMAARKQMYLSNVQALSAHPKVSAVALTSLNPLDTSYLAQMSKSPDNDKQVTMHSQLVGEGYFSLLGLQFLAGQTFTQAETDTRQSVIINQAAAKLLGVNANEVGKLLYGRGEQPVKLLGIVEDIYSYAEGAPATVYYPHDFFEGNMVVKFMPNQSMSKYELTQVLQQHVNTQSIREVHDLALHLSNLNQSAVLSFYSGIGLSFLMIMQVLVGLYGLLANLAFIQQPVLLIKQQVGATRWQLILEQMRARLVHFLCALLIATCVTLGLASLLPMVTLALFYSYVFSAFIVFITLFTIDFYHLKGQLKKY
ncbi:ABC transporter permease [Pseudoalteromonas luteoviolacea]|nr:ABC transporter permease [Pseudoalteromonas luteoviolacea]